jgi:alkanesulfonate monooxygenase SsuD/methylene tetrahydromethanopterin reductase-like flavin-dependent oxidoreductase (luciferase family)
MISKGRLVSGIVRGAGQEQICMNSNPAYNRERFDEAHNLLVRTMTEDGPFHWEGEHYQFRVVNPWAKVLQKPHPRIWVPGVLSPETLEWAAAHRYPYISLNTPLHLTGQLWEIYDNAARRAGYEPGPENRGYLLRVHVADTDEQAYENAREFMWMQGQFTGVGHPYWVNPPGYGSPSRRLAYAKFANSGVIASRSNPYEEQVRTREIVCGTPETVIRELRVVLETCRPSILMLWGNDGGIDHEASKRCIELTGREVLPALREIGAELELHDPFELDTPVSLKFTPPDELHPSD